MRPVGSIARHNVFAIGEYILGNRYGTPKLFFHGR